MKIKITAKNRLGISKEILALLVEREVDVKRVEVVTGLMYLETEKLDKHIERNIASQMMQIAGVKWVESVALMPASERSLYLTSLLNAIGDPVFGINNKGIIIYKNQKALENFQLTENRKLAIKDIFTEQDWANKIDTAASGNLPVNIKTIAGPMLVEVRAIQQQNQKTIGAVLVFHRHEHVATRTHVLESAEIKGFDALIAENKNMQDVIKRARHMSNTQVPLVIYGESGVGKKTIAQAIHHAGQKKNKLFSTINCSSLKPLQVETELFGIASPTHGKAGLLEIASGGTIYIQSIQEMPTECQDKLLKYIETSHFYRVNGKIKKQVNVKIIASCPMPLKQYVENGSLSSELFYALDITQLHIPALRDRTEDIELLVASFLLQFKNHGGKDITGLSFAALDKVKSYYWPGNIAQLKNVLFKASLLTTDNIIEINHIETDGHIPMESSLKNRSLPQAVAEFEKHFLQHWYQKYSSTRKLASQLGVSHTTIAQKLNKYDIS